MGYRDDQGCQIGISSPCTLSRGVVDERRVGYEVVFEEGEYRGGHNNIKGLESGYGADA